MKEILTRRLTRSSEGSEGLNSSLAESADVLWSDMKNVVHVHCLSPNGVTM